MYLADAAEGISSSKAMENFTDTLGELKVKLSRLEKENTAALEESDTETDRANDKVLKKHQLLIEHLAQLVEASLTETEERNSERKTMIKNDVKDIAEIISEIQDLKDNIDPANEKNETKLFVCMKRTETKFSSFKDKLDKLQISNTYVLEFVVTQQILDITEDVESFGKLDKAPLNNHTCEVDKHEKEHNVNLKDEKSLGKLEQDTLYNQSSEVVKHGKEHTVKIQDEESCCISSICQMKDGTIILSDYSNNNLKRLDSSYRVRDHLNLSAGPTHICCSGENELAVALHEEGEVWFVSIADTVCLTSYKLSIGHRYCKGVACVGDTLFVSCGEKVSTNDDCVKMFNKRGDLLNIVVNDSNRQPLFQSIRRLIVSQYDEFIYIADVAWRGTSRQTWQTDSYLYQ